MTRRFDGERSNRNRQTQCGLVAVFSLLVLSSYVGLWRESNRDWRVVATALLLFIAAVIFAPRRNATVCAAFLFCAFRWTIAAVFTSSTHAMAMAIGYFALPMLLFAADSWKQKEDLKI